MITQCDYLGAPECPCFRFEHHKHQRACDSPLVTAVICFYILWLQAVCVMVDILWLQAVCVMVGFMLISGPL